MPRMPKEPKQTDGAAGPAKARRPSARKANGNGGPATVSSDEVARKAYEIYESRGWQDGADFDDWIQAERLLKESQSQPPPPAERKRSRPTSGA